MTAADELFDPEAVAALLALASAAVDGEAVGLLDRAGHLVAGRSPGTIAERAHRVTHGSEVVGAVVGTNAVRPELLALVARSLELVLVGADERAVRERVAQELTIGRRIQLGLVPRRFPEAAGWTFAAVYEPALEVGGDLFDAFRIRGRNDQIGALVADVAGKGIPAALAMADARALLHAAADNADGPAEALARVNRILVQERRTGLPLTAALLVVEVATGRMRYASAGHEAPLVARCTGVVEPLVAGGPILGMFGDAAFEEREASLEPGDALVLYTDGVTDARDERRRFFGDERLLAVVGGACGRTADVVANAIVGEVRAFRGAAPAYDDVALLVIERHRGG